VLVLFTGVASYQVDFWEVLRKEGVDAAKNLNMELAEKDQALSLFREASIYYREGNYQKALEYTNLLLGNPDYENHWGNCYFLLGSIESDKGNYAEAINFFTKAKVFSEFKNFDHNLPSIYYWIARSYLFLGDWPSFEYYLNLIPESHNTLRVHLGAWGSALRDTDYPSAIESIKLAIGQYHLDGAKLALRFAKVDLAVFHLLNYELHEAMAVLLEVEKLNAITPDTDLYYYNLIVKLGVLRCMGYEFLNEIDRMREFTTANQKGTHLSVLNLITDIQCRRD
jgi:tetratricopeptide (TPR) repeat protein